MLEHFAPPDHNTALLEVRTMAIVDSTERVIVDGFEPVSVDDIEGTASITYEQAEAMSAIFRSISRLTDDREIKALCEHGALQADLQANDIDVIRERAVNAGLDARGVRHG
ncbi:hypothetical protein A8F72_02975 [Burkholderia cenocepacia]|nr:hypothetical protein TQ36_02570 [Burkholderia cenocepacia]AQQ49542.1 hypothetical protein A8F32_27730 [Burkholderia cenocepacia]ONI94428.1 hypothetical protein A8F53_29340 [Burkholderia cenocepacia]ONJ06926.1 hypothetical protein A8F33_10225 [Burkholderia cenocepacia]ONJ09649.1 hypothetical protein A8F33_10080 [Burkholderia cenocepacia]